MSLPQPVVLVHGGAGAITDDTKAQRLLSGVKSAAHLAYQILASGATVLDAVQKAVEYLEDDENFNAGKGSVLNTEGDVEMDASIMQGSDLNAGAVTVVQDIQHPIALARLVMEKTSHVLMAGKGAKKFAVENGFQLLEPGALVTEATRRKWRKGKEIANDGETVGAVAIDGQGRLAAATSTGGRDGKLPGRCSDTCMIGSGTYADDSIGAVSTTGHGETIAKFCLAHAIIKEMEGGCDANEATNQCIKRMTEKLKNTAGAITLSSQGDIGVGFSTNRMPWAFQRGNELWFGIDQGQRDLETVYITM